MSEYAELQSTLESVLAHRAEIKLRIKRREMVPVEGLKRRTIDLAIATRDALLYAPVRHASQLAATVGVDPALVFTVLTATMRRTLTSISRNGPPEIGGNKAKAKANGST